MGAVERVRDLILPILESADVELYDIEHESGILRVVVDRSDGIDVDALGKVSQEISAVLDETDPLPDSRYLLEVTSPGIERKLRLPQHFKAQVGEDINLKVKSQKDGPRRFEAKLQAADDNGIEVVVDFGNEQETRRLQYEDIEAARLVYHWEEMSNPKPGKRTKKSQSASTSQDSVASTKKKAPVR